MTSQLSEAVIVELICLAETLDPCPPKYTLIDKLCAIQDAMQTARQALKGPPSVEPYRQCSICKAIVASYPEGMCCHCVERPWPITAIGEREG